MAIVNLLSAYPSVNDLAHLSRQIEHALDGVEFEERESSNYIDGRYYSGNCDNVRIVVALSDETDHDDLPYWITLSSNEMDEGNLIAFANNIVKGNLLPYGFKVARFASFGRVDEQRIDY